MRREKYFAILFLTIVRHLRQLAITLAPHTSPCMVVNDFINTCMSAIEELISR